MNTKEKSNTVSIVIPARNEEDVIGACLDHVFASTIMPLEVIVVDNGSTDATKKIATAYNITYIYEETPGVGRARKRGTAAATGEYVLHIDADTHLRKTYIAEALERFSHHSDLVCLGGRMVWYDAPLWFNLLGRSIQSLFVLFVRMISLGKIGPMGNNMLFIRSLYLKTGGFDETCQFGEDADLARKLSKYGRVRLDLSLISLVSRRRFRLNADLFLYLLNGGATILGLPPVKNVLPSPKRLIKTLRATIDK